MAQDPGEVAATEKIVFPEGARQDWLLRFLAMTWTGADRNLLAAQGIFDNSRLPTCITFRRGVSTVSQLISLFV